MKTENEIFHQPWAFVESMLSASEERPAQWKVWPFACNRKDSEFCIASRWSFSRLLLFRSDNTNKMYDNLGEFSELTNKKKNNEKSSENVIGK